MSLKIEVCQKIEHFLGFFDCQDSTRPKNDKCCFYLPQTKTAGKNFDGKRESIVVEEYRVQYKGTSKVLALFAVFELSGYQQKGKASFYLRLKSPLQAKICRLKP